MEREATLLIVSFAMCGPLCIAFGALVRPIGRFDRSGRHAEAAAWRRLWLPLAPAGVMLILLVGWALQAPDDTDNALSARLLVVAIPGALLGARAVARAASSLWQRHSSLAATIGLVHPKVVIDESLSVVLDAEALAAVDAHERAHARHRDPLQIWLAQVAADLQWPFADLRFRQWLHGLEVARDEEAREQGINGDALALAVVTVAQLAQARPRAVATLIGSGELLRDRITRLLRPMVRARRSRNVAYAVTIAGVIAIALCVGMVGGDWLLRCLPGVS